MNISTLVWFVVYAIGAGAIVGLLWFLIGYCESQIGGFPMFWKVIRLIFVVLVVLILCFLILSLMGGAPPIRWQ